MVRFKKYLTRLASLLSISLTGEFSLPALLDTCQDLLEKADRLGRGLIHDNMLKNVHKAFTGMMQAAGPYVTARLRSDDPSLALRDDFIPATAIEVRDFIAQCYDGVASFGTLHGILPDAMMRICGAGQAPGHAVSLTAAAATSSSMGGALHSSLLCNYTRQIFTDGQSRL